MSTRKRFEPMLQPWIFFSKRNSTPWSSTFVPMGIMPITVAVPPFLSIWKACSVVALRPIASKA